MKKIFSTMMLVGALLATACSSSDDDITPSYDGDAYVGSIAEYTITMGQSSLTIPVQTGVTVYFTEDNSVGKLTFAQTSFTGTTISIPTGQTTSTDVTGMPKLDIVLPNLVETNAGVFERVSFSPEMLDGETFDTTTIKSIDSVTVTETDNDNVSDTIAVELECTVAIAMGGDEKTEVTLNITFNGTEVE